MASRDQGGEYRDAVRSALQPLAMAHGTPPGIADNDERYGAKGAFMIEAGISSSYHIASFFGLTDRIHKPSEVSQPVAAPLCWAR